MEPFFQPDRLWPAGYRQLQLMITPDLDANPELAAFVTQLRAVMANHPGTKHPVPDASLHLTVQTIYLPGQGHVDTATRAQLVTALKRELATVPAFDLLVGSAMVYHRGVVADTHYRTGFDHVVARARRVIAEICAPDAITHDSRPAHMALCYASGYGDCDNDHDLQRQIRHEVLPGHGSLTIGAVDLVETEQNLETYCYDSTVLHRFTLATSNRA